MSPIELSLYTEINKILNQELLNYGEKINDNESFLVIAKSKKLEYLKKKDLDKDDPNNEDTRYQVLSDFNYKCPTYPSLVIVPDMLTESEIDKCIDFRANGRLPVLSYIYRENGER